MNNKGLDCLALTIAIIGAINWGLIVFFSFDLVAFIFVNMSCLSRIIYALLGIAGLYIIKNSINTKLQNNDVVFLPSCIIISFMRVYILEKLVV